MYIQVSPLSPVTLMTDYLARMNTALKGTAGLRDVNGLISLKAILKYRHGSFAQGFYRPQMVLFYLTRPLLLGEAPHPLLNTLASPKSFTLGNVQMHLSLHSFNQDFPLLRSGGLNR